MNVSAAARKSSPECAASESNPRLFVCRPTKSFSAVIATAAITELSAMRFFSEMPSGDIPISMCGAMEILNGAASTPFYSI